MSEQRCKECGFYKSNVSGPNHTAWCPNATTKDWPKEILKNRKPPEQEQKL